MATMADSPKCKFEPVDLQADTAEEWRGCSLPDDSWLCMLECQCEFPLDIFSSVMMNLVKNPNITSSHLFRADILVDSERGLARNGDYSHVKAIYRPREAQWPDFKSERTIVRELIPRNPQIDNPLVQTCHFFRQNRGVSAENGNKHEQTDTRIVLYIPHVREPSEMPFYHPTVLQLAFVYNWRTPGMSGESDGKLTVLYKPFPGMKPDNKLSRTALRLLQTVHKHGQGQLAGYEKRVHLDQLIPQKRYQDTYTALKVKYGKKLAEQWVEVTDPGKHVFEDIGIAAFLIELWRDMYQLPTASEHATPSQTDNKPPFPGFVDIGCGNGLLVHLLRSEGYSGWGFDARNRKTWSALPESTTAHLSQRILVPAPFQKGRTSTVGIEEGETEASLAEAAARTPPEIWHDGRFTGGEFIVSNHADELTVWTPLLAYLNNSAFIAIPCCSHDLSGARFRAPATTRAAKTAADGKKAQQETPSARLPQQEVAESPSGSGSAAAGRGKGQVAETGSLRRTDAQKRMPSAYATLCSYVTSLADAVGFVPEQEVLRIPSTRNQCIIGRKRALKEGHGEDADGDDVRMQRVVELVEEEMKKPVGDVGAEWIARVEKLMLKPGSGH